MLNYRLKSVQPFHATGACALLDISTPVDKQVDWLARQEPTYFITYPPNLGALLLSCREQKIGEILDAEGKPCLPVEFGRLVISDLYNFSMPLICYDIGDLAELGEPRPCERRLPVLKDIMGQERGMLTLADGSRIRPDFGGPHFCEVADIRQY